MKSCYSNLPFNCKEPISTGQMYLRNRQRLRAVEKIQPNLPEDVAGILWSMIADDDDLPNKLEEIISNHQYLAGLSEEKRYHFLLKKTLPHRLNQQMIVRKELAECLRPYGIPTVYPGIGGWVVFTN